MSRASGDSVHIRDEVHLDAAGEGSRLISPAADRIGLCVPHRSHVSFCLYYIIIKDKAKVSDGGRLIDEYRYVISGCSSNAIYQKADGVEGGIRTPGSLSDIRLAV